MVKHIPPGGNWRSIPIEIPSARLDQIRRMSAERGIVRTTYYGRLRWDRPSYTISTYFSRIGNGCFIHPEQNRLISLREAARLQSFRDSYRFFGSRTSKHRLIGNAVPPLLAWAIAKELKEPGSNTLVDLFAGAGGLGEGFRMAGFEPIAAQEMESSSVETYRYNHGNIVVAGDIRLQETKKKLIQFAREREPEITVVAGGPPCQGFSMAGWFKSEDARNDLFRDFLEIVDVLEPKHVVMENVQGLIWMKKGQILETILEEFRKRDLRTECRVLKAEEFGVPQLRRRVFIIGSRGTAPRYPSPLYGQSSLDRAPPFTVYDAMSDLAAIDSGEMREEMPYQVETKTDYQRWCRGIIPAEQLVLSRSLPWVES